MRFRPDDQYCKPALSKTVVGSSLILKVKRHRTVQSEANHSLATESARSSDGVGTHESEVQYSAELMGICNKTYQFTGVWH